MQVKSVRKGPTMKVVTLAEVTEVNDKALVEAALSAAGETQGSIFGYNVTYFFDDEPAMSAAVVDLYTD